MKKKNEEELKKEECCCEHECTCDEHCDCGDECECGCCDTDLPPLEEKLVLVGYKDDDLTAKAIKYLDKEEVDYAFLDLKEEKDKFFNLEGNIEVPTLLLVQTVISGIASGLDEIKEAIEGE